MRSGEDSIFTGKQVPPHPQADTGRGQAVTPHTTPGQQLGCELKATSVRIPQAAGQGQQEQESRQISRGGSQMGRPVSECLLPGSGTRIRSSVNTYLLSTYCGQRSLQGARDPSAGSHCAGSPPRGAGGRCSVKSSYSHIHTHWCAHVPMDPFTHLQMHAHKMKKVTRPMTGSPSHAEWGRDGNQEGLPRGRGAAFQSSGGMI